MRLSKLSWLDFRFEAVLFGGLAVAVLLSALSGWLFGINPLGAFFERFIEDAKLTTEGSRANIFDLFLGFMGGFMLMFVIVLPTMFGMEKIFRGGPNDPNGKLKLPLSRKVVHMDEWLRQKFEELDDSDPLKRNEAS